MGQKIDLAAAALLLFGAVPGGFAQSAALKTEARAVFEKNKGAVVGVEIITRSGYAMMGRESRRSERRIDMTGTVVDADGLTLISDARLDLEPGSAFSEDYEGDNIRFQVKNTITEAKIILADGTEVPAHLVLRDKDLDLAFLRPLQKPDKAWSFVALPGAPEPKVLDDVILIGRLGRAANRGAELSLGTVSAVIAKPRTFYACDIQGRSDRVGSPVFDAGGRALGVLLIRKNPNPARGSSSYGYDYALGGQEEQMVVPARDIADESKQASTAAPAR